MRAFIFQTCSNMPLDKFREFDVDLIDKLGREYVGKKKWKKLSRKRQIEMAYEAVSDPEGYQDGLEDSNFHKFLNVLEVLIGGEATQTKVIQTQIRFSLTSISWGTGIVDRLEVIYKKIIAALPTDALESASSLKLLKGTFWKFCNDRGLTCFSAKGTFWILRNYYRALACDFRRHEVRELAFELKKYNNFAAFLGWDEEAKLSVATIEKCFLRWLELRRVDGMLVTDLKAVYGMVQEMSVDATVNPYVLDALKNVFMPLYEKCEETKLEEFKSTEKLHGVSSLADRLTEYGKFAMELGWDEQTRAVCRKFQELVRKQINILCEAASRNPADYDRKHSSGAFSKLSRVAWNGVFRSILLLGYSKRFCMDFGSEIVWMEDIVNRNVVLDYVQPQGALRFRNTTEKVSVPSSIDNRNHFGYVAWKYCEFMDAQLD